MHHMEIWRGLWNLCTASHTERCAWCQAQMTTHEATAEAFLAALRLAYPDENGGIDLDAVIQETRRRDREGQAPEDTHQLRLWDNENA